jgi:predicted dehydrogenase
MARSAKSIRVAIIGSGGISGAHANGYLKHADRIRCTTLVDIDPEAIARRSDQLGTVQHRYSDWKKMLAERAEDIDAVDICLPHHLHAPAILDAAKAGKHILCEKPMCISLHEADDIAHAVAKAGITYMSGHNQLFMPVVREAKRMIESGELGAIRWIRSQDCFAAGRSRAEWGWRATLATQGGGELIDTGYHPSYRLLHLAGAPVRKVHSVMGRFREPLDGEDTASVQVEFENGILGEIFTSWAMNLPYGTHQIHVIGEKAQIFGTENDLYLLPTGSTEPVHRAFEAVDTFEAEIRHFAECILEKKRPLHSVEEGRAVLELILEASKSAAGWSASQDA